MFTSQLWDISQSWGITGTHTGCSPAQGKKGPSSTPKSMTSSRWGTNELSHQDTMSLLLEMMSQEPTVLACMRIVQSSCLAQGFKCEVRGKLVTQDFAVFMQRHYLTFCEHAIRCMYTCGFVPWRLRRIQSGDVVPEVLPLGTFGWGVQVGNQHSKNDRDTADPIVRKLATLAGKHAEHAQRVQHANPGMPTDAKRQKTSSQPQDIANMRQKLQMASGPRPLDDNTTKYMHYVLHITESAGIKENMVEIYEYIQPTNNIMSNSPLYSTISTPMAHAIIDFRIQRQAQIRMAYADAWNCQVRSCLL